MIDVNAKRYPFPYDAFIVTFKKAVLDKIQEIQDNRIDTVMMLGDMSPLFTAWVPAISSVVKSDRQPVHLSICRERFCGLFYTTTCYKNFITMLYDLRRVSYGQMTAMLRRMNTHARHPNEFTDIRSLVNTYECIWSNFTNQYNTHQPNGSVLSFAHSYYEWNNPTRMGAILIKAGIPIEIVKDVRRANIKYIRLWFLIWEFLGMRQYMSEYNLSVKDMCDITDMISHRLRITINEIEEFKTWQS